MYIVDLDLVKKPLKKMPYFIRDKVQIWTDMVEKEGLPAVQKVRGFKDHILKGNRKGQRSVYLNKKWRLIYTLNKEGQINIIIVKEVIPHDY
ncbi:MAG: type II toxin-antitoxin system mRNA interferase toxin, RelE/StbE family [Bdellovibrionales bacterium]|nr:type II toxin-antitoxin system mRNA interferase toxin, RelE/StbE family [Bdellovibrionales bacterium]